MNIPKHIQIMHDRAVSCGQKDPAKDPYWSEEIPAKNGVGCLCFKGKPRNRGCIEICQLDGDPDYVVDGDWFRPATDVLSGGV